MRTHVLMWYSELPGLTSAGSLVTAGDLLFQGSGTDFFALDARSGKQLFKYTDKRTFGASPLTYQAGGTQYVAITSGNSVLAFALR